ncbi:MAG: universal stress protein [Nitrospiraceae bacterium]|nr:universal stress protein [Nitrospiraceae bacterium]
MIRKILVGVDGSPASNAALGWVAELARSLSAEVVALHSLGLLSPDYDGQLVPTEWHRKAIIDEFEQRWCLPLVEAGVHYKPVVVDGNPVSAILVVAFEEEVDLVVLGSRGHKVTADVLGSTSHQVAERACCPVVIIPPKRDEPLV